MVNASRTVGARTISFSSEKGGGSEIDDRELHSVGELSVLLYDVASSSPNMALISSKDASLSFKGWYAGCPHTLQRSHWPTSVPRSWSYLRSSWVSSRNRKPTVRPNATTAVQTRFGSRYGNVSKMVPSNQAGRDKAGRARIPPSDAPTMVLQKSGQCWIPISPFKGTRTQGTRRRALSNTRALCTKSQRAMLGRRNDKLTLVLLHRYQFCDGGLENADVPASALASA